MGLQLKFATRFPKKMIKQKGRKKNQRKSDKTKKFDFFFSIQLKKILRGGNSGGAFLKGLEGADLRWGSFKGGRI